MNSNNPAELLGSNGNSLSGTDTMLVFCWPTSIATSSTTAVASEYYVQRNSSTPPGWLIQLLTPSSTASVRPQLVVVNDDLHLTNGIGAGNWAYRCRFEGNG